MVAGGAAVVPHWIFDAARPMPAAIAAEMAEAPYQSLHYHALFGVGHPVPHDLHPEFCLELRLKEISFDKNRGKGIMPERKAATNISGWSAKRSLI